ncbi:MAG: orotidine-5'-phosphate decarboxylase [Candidatus Beckwithbacteria bacterium]|nr:orotidine-5'-phosphate decarboxylase [Patescibacteria group bacterium]
MRFIKKLEKVVKEKNSLVCVGLDSNFDKLPDRFKQLKCPQFEFNKWIIDQTVDFVCAYKPNFAFYEARGERGWLELRMTMEYLRHDHSGVVTIADAKRGDIGNTNQGYVKAIFDDLGFDAVTVNPYFGREALQPFLERKDKGIIVLCRTSNPGAGEFQDLKVDGKPVWQIVAEKVRDDWNKHGNCMLVVGATYPEELYKVRNLVKEMTLLVPGIGAQGGDVEKTIKAGLCSNKMGLIINSSRGIIFDKNPGLATMKLRDKINQYR